MRPEKRERPGGKTGTPVVGETNTSVSAGPDASAPPRAGRVVALVLCLTVLFVFGPATVVALCPSTLSVFAAVCLAAVVLVSA